MAIYKLAEGKSVTVKTSWGTFRLGQTVYLSEVAKENDSYTEFFDKSMIIDWIDTKDMGLGVPEPIFSFTDVPFSLYGYEIAAQKKQ